MATDPKASEWELLQGYFAALSDHDPAQESVLKPAERELLLDLLVRLIEGNWIHARPGAGRRKRKQRRAPSSKE
jgi:hypothetical protein